MLGQPVICEKCPLRRKRAMHKIDPLLLIFFVIWFGEITNISPTKD